mmetsp:Transcript_37304/g.84511  ORF Transcript_37304/g.84511 Transcript_37304/m.84511 type:complete len:265 (-) Transcript_37304:583-1377(-)
MLSASFGKSARKGCILVSSCTQSFSCASCSVSGGSSKERLPPAIAAIAASASASFAVFGLGGCRTCSAATGAATASGFGATGLISPALIFSSRSLAIISRWRCFSSSNSRFSRLRASMSRWRCWSSSSRLEAVRLLPPSRRALSFCFSSSTVVPAFFARALASASSSLAFFSSAVSWDEPPPARALAASSPSSSCVLTETSIGSSMSASSRCSESQLIASSSPAFDVFASAFCARSSVKPISTSWSTDSCLHQRRWRLGRHAEP